MQRRPTGPAKPPPKPTFTLSGRTFTVDGATITPKGKDDSGWKFTLSAAGADPGPAGAPPGADSTSTTPGSGTAPAPPAPAEFHAERTMPDSDYRSAAGVSDVLGERARVTVAAGKVTVDARVAVLAASGAPPLTIPLDGTGAPSTRPLAVGTGSADALDVSMTGDAQNGDTISISTSKRKELYVFSTLTPAAGQAVKGFMEIGKQVLYQGSILGVDGDARTKAGFVSTFDKLASAGKVKHAIRARKEIFSAMAEIEGGFDTTQTSDAGVLSFGFGQWTANASLPQLLRDMPDDVFNRNLGQYGLGRGTPSLGTESQMRRVLTTKEWVAAERRGGLSLRSPSEGSITLDAKELISANAYALAKAGSDKYHALATRLEEVTADLAGTDAHKAKLAEKTVDSLWAELAGLPRPPKAATPRSSPGERANTLMAQVTAAKAEADKVVAGAKSVEAIRTNEWVLRFQIAGQDPAVQVVELEHAHATLDGLNRRTDGTGAPFGTLLPTDRGQAVLISTFLNSPARMLLGLKAAVPAFRQQKVAEAEKLVEDAAAKVKAVAGGRDPAQVAEATRAREAADKAKAAWETFPWASGDDHWSLYTNAAAVEFLEEAQPRMLSGTTSPHRRRDIIREHFPR